MFLSVCCVLLLPAIYGFMFFGLNAFFVVALSVGACVASELLYNLFTQKRFFISDASCLVTGIILGLTMPVKMPLLVVGLSGFVAVFFSSVLFVLMHGALQQTVYQLVMAIMLGYLACVGGSIVYSIILHFLNNALVVLFSCFDIVSYLSAENTIYYNVFSMIFPFCLFLLGVILVGILFWVLKYLRNKNFFRYESKTARKLRKQKELELSNQKKLGLKDFWGNITQVEKLFMLISVALIGFLWLVNTINGFIV
jgi:hypothetical protein